MYVCMAWHYQVAAKSISPDGSPHASHRLDLFAQPTAVFWNPRTEEDVEDRYVCMYVCMCWAGLVGVSNLISNLYQ